MTNKAYRQTINDFLSGRYHFLYECATNILKSKRTEAGDLVSELAIFLYDNKEKLAPYLDMKMLEGFSVSWMRIQGQYDSTPFSIKHSAKKKTDYIDDKRSDESHSLFEVEDKEATLDFDNISDDEYIKDLKRIYTDDQIESILKIHDIYPGLSKVNKILFDAYFLKGLTYEKIKDQYTFFRTKNGKKIYYKSKKSIWNMMKDLKTEIKSKL